MKLAELVGKTAVRTQSLMDTAYGSGFGGLGGNGATWDNSYTTNPIEVVRVVNGIIFFRALSQRLEEKKVLDIMCPKYNDNSWAPIPDDLLKEYCDARKPV